MEGKAKPSLPQNKRSNQPKINRWLCRKSYHLWIYLLRSHHFRWFVDAVCLSPSALSVVPLRCCFCCCLVAYSFRKLNAIIMFLCGFHFIKSNLMDLITLYVLYTICMVCKRSATTCTRTAYIYSFAIMAGPGKIYLFERSRLTKYKFDYFIPKTCDYRTNCHRRDIWNALQTRSDLKLLTLISVTKIILFQIANLNCIEGASTLENLRHATSIVLYFTTLGIIASSTVAREVQRAHCPPSPLGSRFCIELFFSANKKILKNPICPLPPPKQNIWLHYWMQETIPCIFMVVPMGLFLASLFHFSSNWAIDSHLQYINL